MAQREKGGRVVFIGNIPYGVSEEQICEIFGRIGAVLNFRLVYDKETGKPKGFGFLEYGDVDAAASAVRNLNGFDIMGRELKVDYSNDNSGRKQDGGGDSGSGRAPPPAHFNMAVGQPPMPMPMPNGMPPDGASGNVLPQLPPGVPLEPGMTAPDAISKTIQAIPAAQLLDILSQMKNLVATDPQKATALLSTTPQLGYAIFQALLLMNLVDANIIGQLIQAPPPQSQPPPQPYAQPPQPPYAQPPQIYGQPPQPPPQFNPYQQPPPGYAPTPPQPQPQYHPPPPQQQQQAPPPQAVVPPGQEALIQQVLNMPLDQIMALGDGPRQQIMALRAQFGKPVL